MQAKRDLIKQALMNNDYKKAISIASKFQGKDMNEIKDAQLEFSNPSFYRQIGKNPDAVIENAIKVMQVKFA
jgi:hypothetical protein